MGIATLREVLTDLTRTRPASVKPEYWPYTATAIIRRAILEKPDDYLALRDFLASLDPNAPLLEARAILGDKSVIPELMTMIRSQEFLDDEFARYLVRIEGPELYQELSQMATPGEDRTRANVVKSVAALRGRERMKILSKVAVDPRNYFGNYVDNGTIGRGAVIELKVEPYPNEAILALLDVVKSDTAGAYVPPLIWPPPSSTWSTASMRTPSRQFAG